MDNNDHYEAAVHAGAAKLHAACHHQITQHDADAHKYIAAAVVDAARPHIEQDVGERIAAAIEAVADGVTGSPSYRHVYIDALTRSAAIARYLASVPANGDTRPANDHDYTVTHYAGTQYGPRTHG